MNKQLAMVDLVPVPGGTGFVIPVDILARLDAEGKGRLALVQDSDGSVKLESPAAEFDRQMAIGRDIIQRRSHALSVLAK